MNDKLYYVIVNPMSASGRGVVVWDSCKNYMDKHNIRYKAFLTSYAGQAAEIAAELTKTGEDRTPVTIIVIGGDGTLGEVITGLNITADVTIAPISAGSGNDFIRANKLSKNCIRRLKQILRGRHEERIDYGVITYFDEVSVKSRRFAVSSGVGYDAEICDGVNLGGLKKKMNRLHAGKLTYVFIAVKTLFSNRCVDMEVTLDGVKTLQLKDVRYISSHVLRMEGGGVTMAPKADAQDGLLDLCIVSGTSKAKLAGTLLKALIGGKHVRSKGVQMQQCSMAFFRLNNPATVHADGDILGELDSFQIICEKGKIRAIL